MRTRNTQRASLIALLILLLAAIIAPGCAEEDDITSGPSVEEQQSAVSHYAAVVHRSYAETATRAATLKAAVDAFVASPSAATLSAAKDAWNETRELYGQTEGYRFYAGPIDDDDGPEGQLNAWPLDENYIDYTRASADVEPEMTGIVNDTAGVPTVTIDVILASNEAGGEKNISAGFHAIEFLLWGQDFNADGPGDRPHTDYLTGDDATAPNGDRRGQYLALATAQLQADLDGLAAEWDPEGSDNYHASFTSADPTASLRKLLRGIGTLSGAELSKERAFAAYAEQDQEEEHSCFSDTTHVDMIANALSIQNVYEGRFGTFADPTRFISDPDRSLKALVAAANPDLAAQISADIQAAVDAGRAIPVPFDQSILSSNPEDRAKILTFVEALETATTSLVEGAATLGIDNLNTELE